MSKRYITKSTHEKNKFYEELERNKVLYPDEFKCVRGEHEALLVTATRMAAACVPPTTLLTPEQCAGHASNLPISLFGLGKLFSRVHYDAQKRPHRAWSFRLGDTDNHFVTLFDVPPGSTTYIAPWPQLRAFVYTRYRFAKEQRLYLLAESMLALHYLLTVHPNHVVLQSIRDVTNSEVSFWWLVTGYAESVFKSKQIVSKNNNNKKPAWTFIKDMNVHQRLNLWIQMAGPSGSESERLAISRIFSISSSPPPPPPPSQAQQQQHQPCPQSFDTGKTRVYPMDPPPSRLPSSVRSAKSS
jgi:hypothetical protein